MDSPPSISASLFIVFFSMFSPMRCGVLAAHYNYSKLAPAFYVLGDSIVDVGNNNHLLTFIKANFPHNGVDFAGGKATGRFSNGKNAADFFAEMLGLKSPPPYLSVPSGPKQLEAFLGGINFASGGAGVLDATFKHQCISLETQIDHLATVYETIAKEVGNDEAQRHVSRSIIGVSIGNNDILSYLEPLINLTPKQYVDSMVSSFQEHLKRIYNIGGRKLMFMGIGPIGCCPCLRNVITGECNETANHMASLFNQGAASLLRNMKSKLPDLNYSFFNTCLAVSELIQNSANHGFTEVKAACCGLGGHQNAFAPCTPVSNCCHDRKKYIFWDFAHPSEAAVELSTNIAIHGSSPYVFPINGRQLCSI